MAKKQKSGRKKVNPAEKVILVGFYTKKSVIETIGGMDKTRSYAKEIVEARASSINMRETLN